MFVFCLMALYLWFLFLKLFFCLANYALRGQRATSRDKGLALIVSLPPSQHGAHCVWVPPFLLPRPWVRCRNWLLSLLGCSPGRFAKPPAAVSRLGVEAGNWVAVTISNCQGSKVLSAVRGVRSYLQITPTAQQGTWSVGTPCVRSGERPVLMTGRGPGCIPAGSPTHPPVTEVVGSVSVLTKSFSQSIPIIQFSTTSYFTCRGTERIHVKSMAPPLWR